MFKIGEFEKLIFLSNQIPIIKILKDLIFFVSFLFKCLINSWVAWIELNFYNYSDSQQKIMGCNNMRNPVACLYYGQVYSKFELNQGKIAFAICCHNMTEGLFL